MLNIWVAKKLFGLFKKYMYTKDVINGYVYVKKIIKFKIIYAI